jgi:regulator of cell morphogenesis and NO signaling
MEQQMTHTLLFDPALTINEIVAQYPETIPVFNRFGIDTCCGGGVRVDEAALRDGIDAKLVTAALNDVLAAQ